MINETIVNASVNFSQMPLKNLTTLVKTGVLPGMAQIPFPDCIGGAYCMPIELCRSALDASQSLHKVIDIGFIGMAVILVLFTEYYFRQSRKLALEKVALEKKLKELEKK